MASQWFVRKGGETSGPLSAADLRKMANLGHLGPGDEVSPDGTGHWVPAHAIIGLLDSGQPSPMLVSPPPLPKKRSDTSGASGTTARYKIRERLCMEGHRKLVTAVAVSGHGRWGLSSTGHSRDDSTIRLWDLRDGFERCQLGGRFRKGHEHGAESIAFSKDGTQALTGGWDHTIRLWEVPSGSHLLKLTMPGCVNSVAFSPNAAEVAGAGAGISIYDIDTGEELQRLAEGWEDIYHVQFINRGRHIACAVNKHVPNTATSTRHFREYDSTLGERHRSVTEFHQTGPAYFEGHLMTYDIRTGKGVAGVRRDDQSRITAVAFTSDGRYGLAGYQNGTLLWIDLERRDILKSFLGHSGAVNCVALMPDGTQFLSAGHDRTFRLWDISTGEQAAHVDCPEGAIQRCAVAKTGDLAFTGSGSYEGGPNYYQVRSVDCAVRTWSITPVHPSTS